MVAVRRADNACMIAALGGFITMLGISFYRGSKLASKRISEALGKMRQANKPA